MAKKNYTSAEPVVRGSRWPPGEDVLTLVITKSTNWPADADTWTWKLLFAEQGAAAGATPEVELTAASASVSSAVITLTFFMTVAQSAVLTGEGKAVKRVELVSEDGAVVSYYYDMTGLATVYDPFE